MAGIKNYYLDIVADKRNGAADKALQGLLLVASCVYAFFAFFTRTIAQARERKLPCNVISVGNLTWGGTGKTPLVALLIQRIVSKGKSVAVLMRGYGSDEDAWLRATFPNVTVISGKDRYKNGMAYWAEHHPDVFLLDDGFQQWRLGRTLDIVTINGLNPWGNGHLIPRGCLRERVRNIKRADVVVITNADLITAEEKERIKERLLRFRAAADILEGEHVPLFFYRARKPEARVPLEALAGKQAIIFSGIASPESFALHLKKIGVNVLRRFEFQDHHQFTKHDFTIIKKERDRDPTLAIITTEKDFMRSRALIQEELDPSILKITMRIRDDHDALTFRLDGLLGC